MNGAWRSLLNNGKFLHFFKLHSLSYGNLPCLGFSSAVQPLKHHFLSYVRSKCKSGVFKSKVPYFDNIQHHPLSNYRQFMKEAGRVHSFDGTQDRPLLNYGQFMKGAGRVHSFDSTQDRPSLNYRQFTKVAWRSLLNNGRGPFFDNIPTLSFPDLPSRGFSSVAQPPNNYQDSPLLNYMSSKCKNGGVRSLHEAELLFKLMIQLMEGGLETKQNTQGIRSIEHVNSILEGIRPNVITCNSTFNVGVLVDSLCKGGLVVEAKQIVNEMIRGGQEPDVFTYNALFKGYCEAKRFVDAIDLFHEMYNKYVTPDVITNLCRKGLTPDIITYGRTLIGALCKAGKIMYANTVFYQMQAQPPDDCSCSILLGGFFKNNELTSAIRWFRSMRYSKFGLGIVSYGVMIDGLCKGGELKLAEGLVGGMIRRGQELDTVAYNSLIDAYFRQSQINDAVRVYNLMVERGWSANVVTYSILIKGYCKAKRIDDAITLFRGMYSNGVAPNVITYSTLIHGLCKAGKIDDAEKLFHEMKAHAQPPNVCICNILLDGLCKSNRLDKAMSLFKKMRDMKFGVDIVSCNVMVDGLCKGGKLEVAECVVGEMIRRGQEPDTITYNSLIDIYCRQNQIDYAIRIFKLMVERGRSPTFFTCSTLIYGCCKAKRFDEAMILFRGMLQQKSVYHHRQQPL